MQGMPNSEWRNMGHGVILGTVPQGNIIILNAMYMLSSGGIHLEIISKGPEGIGKLLNETDIACLPLSRAQFEKKQTRLEKHQGEEPSLYAEKRAQEIVGEERKYWESL
jgi:hypothetical protein